MTAMLLSRRTAKSHHDRCEHNRRAPSVSARSIIDVEFNDPEIELQYIGPAIVGRQLFSFQCAWSSATKRKSKTSF